MNNALTCSGKATDRHQQVNRQNENYKHTDSLKTSRVHKVKGHGLLVTPRGL